MTDLDPSPLDDRIRAGLTALLDQQQPSTTPDQVLEQLLARTGPTSSGRGPRRPRRRVLTAAAVIVTVLLAATTAVVALHRGGQRDRVEVGPVGPTNEPAFRAGWHEWGPYPSADAPVGRPLTWTGSEVVVLGVTRSPGPSDQLGVEAMDPSTGIWRDLPSLPAAFAPADDHQPVITGYQAGSALFVSDGSRLARLDRRADSWLFEPSASALEGRTLEGPVVWSGRELLFPAAGLAFVPATHHWRTMAYSGFSRTDGPWENSWAWTGTELLVAVAPSELTSGAVTSGPEQLWGYDPVTDRWRRHSDLPPTAELPQLVWTGHRVVAMSPFTGGMSTYDPVADRWADVAPLPAPAGDSGGEVSLARIGSKAAVLTLAAPGPTGGELDILEADGSWTQVPVPAPLHSNSMAAWEVTAGDALLVYSQGTAPSLWSYGLEK